MQRQDAANQDARGEVGCAKSATVACSRSASSAIFASAVATTSTPFYYARKIRDMIHFAPPAYLTSGDVSAIKWIDDQSGTGVVLARWDLSPFVASRGHHRVVVGHWLWTHRYPQRRKEVEAVFDNGADPRSLLQIEHVAWVLIDEDRGVPAWAAGVEPAAHFDQTVRSSGRPTPRASWGRDEVTSLPDRS
jgi:hypothetical protein